MTSTDVVGLGLLLLLMPLGLLLWEWQQWALNDSESRRSEGRSQVGAWPYEKWQRRLTWSIPAIVRYRRCTRMPRRPARHLGARAGRLKRDRLSLLLDALAVLGVVAAGSILSLVFGLPVSTDWAVSIFVVCAAIAAALAVVFYSSSRRE